MEATTGFTTKYNSSEVGVQDFYFDLVKEFTVYLLDHEHYTPLIDIFFGDTPFGEQPADGYGEEHEEMDKADDKADEDDDRADKGESGVQITEDKEINEGKEEDKTEIYKEEDKTEIYKEEDKTEIYKEEDKTEGSPEL